MSFGCSPDTMEANPEPLSRKVETRARRAFVPELAIGDSERHGPPGYERFMNETDPRSADLAHERLGPTDPLRPDAQLLAMGQ